MNVYTLWKPNGAFGLTLADRGIGGRLAGRVGARTIGDALSLYSTLSAARS